MSAAQWLAVLVTVGLNAMDGFDVLSISFASPGIAKEWGVDRATLGWVLSMELIGMGLGSVLLGGVADKIGRRPTILGCLVAMSVGMFGASLAGGVATLLAFGGLLTGLGIGGMLAAINAAVAELSQPALAQPRRVPDGDRLSGRRSDRRDHRAAAARRRYLA